MKELNDRRICGKQKTIRKSDELACHFGKWSDSKEPFFFFRLTFVPLSKNFFLFPLPLYKGSPILSSPPPLEAPPPPLFSPLPFRNVSPGPESRGGRGDTEEEEEERVSVACCGILS